MEGSTANQEEPHIMAKVVNDILNLVVMQCVVNQTHDCWLLSNALHVVLSLVVVLDAGRSQRRM